MTSSPLCTQPLSSPAGTATVFLYSLDSSTPTQRKSTSVSSASCSGGPPPFRYPNCTRPGNSNQNDRIESSKTNPHNAKSERSNLDGIYRASTKRHPLRSSLSLSSSLPRVSRLQLPKMANADGTCTVCPTGAASNTWGCTTQAPSVGDHAVGVGDDPPLFLGVNALDLTWIHL